jgi:hypothetical protein
MRKIALLLCLLSFPVLAETLSCDTLLKRVDEKLQAKGVPSYTLEIVSAKSQKDAQVSASGVPATNSNQGKEVGTCDGGTKRLIYFKVD